MQNNNRRAFIKRASLLGAGLTLGLPAVANNR